MHVSVVLSVVTVVVEYVVATETSSQSSDEDPSTTKTSVIENAQPVDMWDSNIHLNSLWAYQPLNLAKEASYDLTAAEDKKHAYHRSMYRPSQPVTRLAKSLSLGFDPYFKKGYFEPFETRPKPVTLIGIRKNGLLPRKTIYVSTPSQRQRRVHIGNAMQAITSLLFWINTKNRKLGDVCVNEVYMTHSDTSSSSSSDESQRHDDNDKLKQALALVDLLKSDYLRVLRENRELRHGISTTTSPNPNDEFTCAETSGEANSTNPGTVTPPPNGAPPMNGIPSVSGGGGLRPAADGAPAANVTPPAEQVLAMRTTPPSGAFANGESIANGARPLTPSLSSVGNHHGQVLGPISGRRFMNLLEENITWKNNTNFRRNMGSLDPANLETSHGTNNSSLQTPPEADAVKNTSYSKNSKSTIRMSAKVTTKTPHFTKKGINAATSLSSHKIKAILKHVESSQTKDPVMDEIASELIMELKDERYGLRAKSNEANETKSSPSIINAVFNKPKSSIRIHLFKSTRLSIPFNPNNAFCYYHPESMLCKTAIKK